jgi:hypothetical protein
MATPGILSKAAASFEFLENEPPFTQNFAA